MALTLLLIGCGGKESVDVIPPPAPVENDDDSGNTGDDTGGNGGGSGVEVTPLGENWTATSIEDGIIYYAFNGTDDISGKHQEVFAVDIDLNNAAYQVKLVYENPRITTSAAFLKRSKAIAAINANYEQGSIYMRVDGIQRYSLANTTIGDTGVPNWKSEGALAFTGEREVKFLWAGSQKKGEVTVEQQRSFYQKLPMDTYPSVISSAPMLIDNFNKVGETFCNYSLSATEVNKLNSEDPDRHQRVRHPRTAVALTENNHLILFVVDGRIKSAGMSARELTRFLVKWFNPQYALNMDGGGSTTMCVRGQGDANTNVVNYPCSENTNYDHTGERARDAFVMIFEK